MAMLVWFIGWLVAFEGVLFLIKPDAAKSVMRFFIQNNRVYIAAVVRTIIAIIFLIAARQCRIPWIVISLGVLLLISGIIGFAVKSSSQKAMLNWWLSRPAITIRLLSIIPLIIGAILVYAVPR
jgi:hypothetical protein